MSSNVSGGAWDTDNRKRPICPPISLRDLAQTFCSRLLTGKRPVCPLFSSPIFELFFKLLKSRLRIFGGQDDSEYMAYLRDRYIGDAVVS